MGRAPGGQAQLTGRLASVRSAEEPQVASRWPQRTERLQATRAGLSEQSPDPAAIKPAVAYLILGQGQSHQVRWQPASHTGRAQRKEEHPAAEARGQGTQAERRSAQRWTEEAPAEAI